MGRRVTEAWGGEKQRGPWTPAAGPAPAQAAP